MGLTAGSQNIRERESVCAVSVSENVKEDEFLEDESIYRQSLSCGQLQMRGTKIKVADVVVSTNHVTFLTNMFPRLISLPSSAIFVSGISGITAILKYKSVNHIRDKEANEVMKTQVYYYHHHHHHHIALVARISLTLSRHSPLSFIALGRSSGQHPVSSHSC